MKQLQLELQERLLIVEAEDDDIYGFQQYLADLKNINTEFICKGDELTEEVAKGLVELHYMNGIRSYDIYNDYIFNDMRWFDNALESFVSAIESKGYFWGKNPYGKFFNPSRTLIFKIS